MFAVIVDDKLGTNLGGDAPEVVVFGFMDRADDFAVQVESIDSALRARVVEVGRPEVLLASLRESFSGGE